MTPAWLRRQLSGPHGVLARPMAHLLDRINGADHQRAVELLACGSGDHVLELGFGGGGTLPLLLQRGARVTGIEPAVAMRARALRKHAWPIAEGRLAVMDGCAEALPDGPFSHALSLNTVYFWDDLEAGMAELRRTVTDQVILGVSPPSHLKEAGFADSGFRVQPISHYVTALERAGFVVSVQAPLHQASCALLTGR